MQSGAGWATVGPMRRWGPFLAWLLFGLAAACTTLAWQFGTNRSLWLGDGEYGDPDSPALILLGATGVRWAQANAADARQVDPARSVTHAGVGRRPDLL